MYQANKLILTDGQANRPKTERLQWLIIGKGMKYNT